MTYEQITGSEVTVELQDQHELRPGSVLDRESVLSDASPGAGPDSPPSRQGEDLDDRSGLELQSVDLERTFPRPAVYSLWFVEIAAFATAVVALVATAIILGIYNGRPLPDWPVRISINAIVSVFAVILKATLMIPVTEAISQLKWSWYRNAHPLNDIAKFDHASRGVWGSFRLIRSLHVRNLGSLGAAITILAIASDPFIQQIINYHHCQQKSVGEAASIVRTNNYTMDGDSLSMMAAIYQGAYRFFSNVEASCGTGNCTFPEYRTLGVCNACEDITSSLKKVPNGESVEESVQVGWDWVLPSGFSIPGWYSSSMSMKTGNLNSTWKYDDSWNTTSIAITEILSPKYQGVDRGTKVLAVRCSLSPCVRTYRANVTQGVFVEEHVDSCLAKKRKSPGTALMSASFVETPMPCLIDGVYHSASSFTKPNATNNLPMYDMLPGGATAWLPKECVYTLFTPFNMQDYLTDFLTSASNGSRINESPWQWQLFNDGNTSLNMINSTWASIADSMTAHIRRNGNRNYSMPVMGVAEKTLTCISVRWGWIAYPAALLALTFVFLFLTVVESANRARGRIWKSSPLAMLFHGLDGEVAEKYQDVGQVGQMEKLAKQVRVKIKDEGKGLKLVEVSP